MIWSKLKSAIESRFAPSVNGRLKIHLTTYKNSVGFLGRAWLTWDGEEIANFSNQDTWNIFEGYSNKVCETGYMSYNPCEIKERKEGNLVEKGEFSKYDFGDTCWSFLNENIKDSQVSHNPIMRALAMVDKRTGKSKLSEFLEKENHPLVKEIIKLRLESIKKLT